MSDNPVRVLLVEDNPGDARLTRDSLRYSARGQYEVEHVERLAHAESILASGAVDVVLLDLSLPDAPRESSVARAYAMAPGVPIIVLTGLDDEEAALEAMKSGAEDYLVKDEVDGELLTRSIRYAIERKRLETSHEQLHTRLEAEHARLRFLADAGIKLAASLDFEETLESVSSLLVESLADFCIIDILGVGEAETRRLRVAHADPEKAGLADQLRDLPLDRERPHLASDALISGSSSVVAVTDDVLRSLAQNEEHLRILQEMNPLSYIAVPLTAREQLLGALVLISSSRFYSSEDLRLAEEVARRAALAVDDARLYRHAQSVIRAREEVLRIVSHDLRNPLSTITMSAEILLDSQVGFSEEQKIRQLHVILRSAERMDRLIEDLLDVARLEAGQLSLDLSHYDPRRLVHEAVELHSAVATARELTLRARTPHRLAPVLADRDRVLQVMGNLIGNAIKFVPEGGEVTVGAEAEGDQVRFWVRDTGPGIPQHELANLFRPFWQGRRGGREGAGLGLAISKGIVEAHGGRIWADSEVGSGTCVSFTLTTAVERRRAGSREAAAPEPAND
jgi:signal transduction histidine kinase/DNA-binding NarL/FixJ family response regulator